MFVGRYYHCAMANADPSFTELDATFSNGQLYAEWGNTDGDEFDATLDWDMMDLAAERRGFFPSGLFRSWFCCKHLEHTPYVK